MCRVVPAILAALCLGIVSCAPAAAPRPADDVTGHPFNYAYAVAAEPSEDSTRLEQAKSEASDGRDVVGVYEVLLPDGNLQTVTYTAGPDGYRANVRYARVGEPILPSGRSDADANRVHPLSQHHSVGDGENDSSDVSGTQFRQRSNRIRDAVSGPRSGSSRSRSAGKAATRFDRIRHSRPE